MLTHSLYKVPFYIIIPAAINRLGKIREDSGRDQSALVGLYRVGKGHETQGIQVFRSRGVSDTFDVILRRKGKKKDTVGVG